MIQSFYNPKHALHATAQVIVDGRPFITEELPARAEIIFDAIRKAALGPIHAPEDLGLQPILDVHDAGYIHYLQTAYDQNTACLQQEAPVIAETFAPRRLRRKPTTFLALKGYYTYGVGSPILAGTWEAAYWSAQCGLSAAGWLRSASESDPHPVVYALCRPPGHHALTDLYGGFCYLNNAAIAARFLNDRVAILDVDYHHGNGTQEIFYADPTILYCSIHARPDDDYPYYWGERDETGSGPGEGFNRNWPLSIGSGFASYLPALSEALQTIRQFHPRYLVVSAGFDTFTGDPAGSFNLTTPDLHEIGLQIASLEYPTLIVQEGGYLLESLGENAVAFLSAFASSRRAWT